MDPVDPAPDPEHCFVLDKKKYFSCSKEGKEALFRIRVIWRRIRILAHLKISVADPDPSTVSSCKNSIKNLDSYSFVTLFDFLSLKNDVNVPSKSNKQKKLC